MFKLRKKMNLQSLWFLFFVQYGKIYLFINKKVHSTIYLNGTYPGF